MFFNVRVCECLLYSTCTFLYLFVLLILLFFLECRNSTHVCNVCACFQLICTIFLSKFRLLSSPKRRQLQFNVSITARTTYDNSPNDMVAQNCVSTCIHAHYINRELCIYMYCT